MQIFGLDNPLFSKSNSKMNLRNLVYAARLARKNFTKKFKVNLLKPNLLFQFVQNESLALIILSITHERENLQKE